MKKVFLCGILLMLSTFLYAQGSTMQVANPSQEAKANALKNPLTFINACRR